MAVREAFLCLLASGPHYGFGLHHEIKRRLPSRRSLNVGQTYTTLERAGKAGLVVHAGATNDGLPLFGLGPNGLRVANEWLGGLDAPGSDPSLETIERVLLRASLGMPVNGALISLESVLDGELTRWQGRLDHANKVRQNPLPEVDAPSRNALWLEALAADFSARCAEAMLAWLAQFHGPLGGELVVPMVHTRPRRGRPVRPSAPEVPTGELG